MKKFELLLTNLCYCFLFPSLEEEEQELGGVTNPSLKINKNIFSGDLSHMMTFSIKVVCLVHQFMDK